MEILEFGIPKKVGNSRMLIGGPALYLPYLLHQLAYLWRIVDEVWSCTSVGRCLPFPSLQKEVLCRRFLLIHSREKLLSLQSNRKLSWETKTVRSSFFVLVMFAWNHPHNKKNRAFGTYILVHTPRCD